MKFRDKLPAALRHRFDSFGGYVNGYLDQAEEQFGRREKLSVAQREFIQCVVFLSALHRFFIEGSEAAEMALGELALHGVKSFGIGSATFEEGSEDLVRGRKLAEEMEQVVRDPRVLKWMKSQEPFYQIIREAASYVRNA